MTALRFAPAAEGHTHSLLTRPASSPPARRRGWWLVVLAALLVITVGGGCVAAREIRTRDLHHDYLNSAGWPEDGEAALSIGGVISTTPHQSPVPIASLAKVMTAYLVLRAYPLHGDAAGFSLRVSEHDVRDTARRQSADQSVVAVRSGERLSERQALTALLLPSANNVAVMLARRVAGSVPTFVARMNAAAADLGMTRTHYTDPSGFDEHTMSTARDQVRLAATMTRDDVFTAIVASTSARLPVAGTVHNTNSLLGQDGFTGTKTGSDDAAGGCLMFRTYRVVNGVVTDVLGVVLGQHGRHDIVAGLTASKQLAARVGPAAGH